MRNNQPIIDQEYVLQDGAMLASQTDLKGIITYCNPDFIKASGFEEEELIGQPHNLVRHPDMPPEAFADLWQTLKEGMPWTGLVKNRRKNGGFYWVLANVTPIAEDGKITGYMSVRSKPSREQVSAAEAVYREMREGRCALKIEEGALVKKGWLPRVTRELSGVGVRGRLIMMGGFFLLALLALVGYMMARLDESDAFAKTALQRVAAQALAVDTARQAQVEGNKQVQEWKNLLSSGQDSATFAEYRRNFEQAGENTTRQLKTLVPLMVEIGGADTAVQAALQEQQHLQAQYQEALRNYVPGKAESAIAADRLVKGTDRALSSQLDEITAMVQTRGKSNLTEYEANAQANSQAHKRAAIGVTVLLLLTGGLWAYLMMSTIMARLRIVRSALEKMARGDYNSQIDAQPHNELGYMLNAMRSMQTKLGFDVVEMARIANENLGVRISLDNVSTGVMIANQAGEISYSNKAMREIFLSVEGAIRQRYPQFNPDNVIGTNIDVFHGESPNQRKVLDSLTTTRRSSIVIGGHHFAIVFNPVISNKGVRLGTVMEWEDQTVEVEIQGEVAQIVGAAVQGDFSQRLEISNKDGFMRELSEGINKLVETSDKGLQEAVRMLGSLARGDLTDRITTEYSGAFGELKNDANATAERLSEIITQIKGATDSINISAHEIASGNNDLSQRTEQNAASLEETAASMEEITSIVKHNADNANRANQLAIGASEVATKGGKVVQEVVTTMDSINEASRKIVDIIAVIDGIAFQTNILALNAAVEAARAGEQGRGFAVVAGEVRNLAQRSAVAAKEIKILIGDSVQRVEGGSKLVAQAGLTMEEIVSSIKRVTEIMSQITGASEEQSTGIAQINHAISQMDGVTQQNAALVEEAAAAAESLAGEAGNLSQAISIFKIDALHDRSPSAHLALPSPRPAD